MPGGAALAAGWAFALAVAAGATPGLPSSDLPPASGSGSGSGISMTTVNDGRPASLLDAAHQVWAHPAAKNGPTEITVSVAVPGGRAHLWSITVDAPNAGDGPTSVSCSGADVEPRAEVSCVLPVAVSTGLNLLEATAVIDGATIGPVAGILLGGVLGAVAGYEVRDATGRWTAVAPNQTVVLSATTQSGLRYVVTNSGTIPFRAVGACDDRVVLEHQQLTCQVRGVRPAQSFGGDYRQRLEVTDLAGGSLHVDLHAGVRTFSGTFVLSAASAVLGQQLVVSSNGLPRDSAFAVQYRLDDQSVPLGTSTTRAGSLRYGFVLRAMSPGPAHLNIEHDGVTIASLPFEVTRTPAQPEAGTPPWAAAVLLLVVVAGVIAWRRRRRRAR